VKKILFSVLLSLVLLAIMAVPAFADAEQNVGASVSVGEVISITLTDAGAAGINFGGVSPGSANVSDVAQSDGTPAIKVAVAPETNVTVDIAIKGAATGSLALTNWTYSKTFLGTKTSIPDTYGTAVYTGGVGSYDFYHWVNVPVGTPAGPQGCNVYYKATKHS
jgi:hypothetical protein